MANTKPIKWLRDILGNKFFPVTHMKAVRDDDGNTLSSALTNINEQISGKQNTLVSGTNIKTVNGNSLLGSGNVDIKTRFNEDIFYTTPNSDYDVTLKNDLGNTVNIIVTSSDPTGAASHGIAGEIIPSLDYLSTELNKKPTKPTSSTDNAVARFNGTTGNIQNSGVTINDNNQVTAAKFITSGGTSSQFVKGDGSLSTADKIDINAIGFKNQQNTFNGSGWYRIYKGTGAITRVIHLFLTRGYNSPAPEEYDIEIENGDLGESEAITITDNMWGVATITQTGQITAQEFTKIRVYGYNGAPSNNANNSNAKCLCIDVYINDKHDVYKNNYKISGYSTYDGATTNYEICNFLTLSSDDTEYATFCQNRGASYYVEFDLINGFKTNKSATASSFIKSGGTSSQFLKADGSVDSNVYITACTCLPYAPVSSPIFTGTPIAPTAATGDSSTQIATTEFVENTISNRFTVDTTPTNNSCHLVTSGGVKSYVDGKYVIFDLGSTSDSTLWQAESEDSEKIYIGTITPQEITAAIDAGKQVWLLINNMKVPYIGQTGFGYTFGQTTEGDTTLAFTIPDNGIFVVTNSLQISLSMPTGFRMIQGTVGSGGTLSVGMADGYMIPTTTQADSWTNKVSNVQSDWNATTGDAVILNKPTVISSIGYNPPGGYLTANNSDAVQLTVCSSNGRKLNIGGSAWLFTSTTEPSASADKSTIAPTWSAMTSAISGKATAVSATAGTYRSVTVNSQGLVTAGTNPTTLSGYGITDAKIASGTITLGSNTITPLTSHQTLKTINSTAITGSGNISIPVVANLNAPNSLPSGASGTGVTISSTNYYLVSDKPYCTSSDVNVAPSWSAIQSCLSTVRTEMGSSGGVTIYSGSSTPSSSLGSNGDIYIQTT